MSNLLEICWQHLMSWLKNKLSNLQSFKTNTVLNGDVCGLLFLSLSSGQLWQQNALKNIQPVLEKDQKRIRCQHQLMSVLQERGKNKVRRWVFLATHHSVFPICTRTSGHSTASLPGDLDPWHEWDRAVHHYPIPLPRKTDQPLFWQHQTFLPVLLLIGLAVLEKAKKPGCWFDLTLNSDRVQGEGSPAHRQSLAVFGSGRWKPLDLWAVAGHGTTLLPCPCYTTSHLICLHLQDYTNCAGLKKCR